MMATLPLIILLVLFVIGFPIGFALMLCVVPYACAALCERHTLHCAVPYYKTSGKRTVL